MASRTKSVTPTPNSNGQIYGASVYHQPAQGAMLIGEAEFEDFAPAPCVCCLPLVPNKARRRFYLRVYENKMEINYVGIPFCCCTQERCIPEYSRNYFFDKPPSRTGVLLP